MSSAQPFPITNYQTPDGNPISNGYVLIRLNEDGSVNDSLLCSNFTKVILDSNGNFTGSPVFYANSDISPINTYYITAVYKSNGELVAKFLVTVE